MPSHGAVQGDARLLKILTTFPTICRIMSKDLPLWPGITIPLSLQRENCITGSVTPLPASLLQYVTFSISQETGQATPHEPNLHIFKQASTALV